MYPKALYITIDLIFLSMFLIGAYYTAIGFFSLFGIHKKTKNSARLNFAAVIPAHNEETVIADLISSLQNCDYPKDKLSIFVIADGCSDKTAEISRRLGAYVITRSVSTSKGDALNDAFKKIVCDNRYDAVAVFDADNIVSRDYFSVMNEKLLSGFVAVQGYVDSKNPDSSWVAYAHSLWYWITNRTVQAGRANLSLGCSLEGTGFVLSAKLLRSIDLSTSSMAEDAEYTCILAENGVKIDYASDAIVFDEKPVTFKESVHQRKRWTRGITDVQGRFSLRFLAKLRFDSFLRLNGDLLSTVIFIVMSILAFMPRFGIFKSTIGLIGIWCYLLLNILIILLALLKDKKIDLKTIPNLLGFTVYIVSWLPIGLFGIFSSANVWHHTKHNIKG